MKTIAFLLIYIVSLSACYTSQLNSSVKATISNSQAETLPCFVEFNDGSTKQYTTLQIVKGLIITPYLMADGATKINARDIKAYQNNDHYAISSSVYKPARKSYVAIESLPGFAIRIAQGKLNIYVRQSYDSNKAVDEYFIQTENETILAFTPTTLKDIIKNNPEAVEYFNSQKFKAARQTLKSTADLYNTSQALTKNK